MPAPTFRAAAGSNSGTGTAATLPTHTLPSGIQTGDVGFMVVTIMANTTLTTSDPTGWTLVSGPTNAGTGTTAARSWLYQRTMQSSDSSAAVTGWSGAWNTFRWAVGSLVLGGADTGAPNQNVAIVQSTAATTFPAPAIDPTVDDCMLAVLSGLRMSASSTGLTTPPTGYTEQVDSVSTNASGNRSAAIITTLPLTGQAAQGALNGTLSHTSTIAGWHLAVAPAAGAPAARRQPLRMVRQAVCRSAVY